MKDIQLSAKNGIKFITEKNGREIFKRFRCAFIHNDDIGASDYAVSVNAGLEESEIFALSTFNVQTCLNPIVNIVEGFFRSIF